MELIRACASVYLAPITMQFDDLVFWPKPKVLCLLAKIVPRDVLNLVHQLQAISEPFGIALEKRPYRPHITLARKANQPVVLNFTPISFTANEFVLMQSMRTDSGPGYEILYRWPLNGTL